MRIVAIILFLQTIWTTGFSQSLSFKFGKQIRSPKLDIEWAAPTNALPPEVLEYRALPNRFSPEAVRELLATSGFSFKENCSGDTNVLLFKNSDETKSLWISYPLGGIRYQTQHQYGPTNLAVDVPGMADLPKLTTNFLKSIGVNISEVEKNSDGTPNFHFWEPLQMFSIGTEIITNISYRAVSFRRALNGASIVGNGIGGDCEVEFGEHGKPQRIWMTWRSIEPYKKIQVADKDTLTKWIRTGKAFQRATRADEPTIQWRGVTKMTVKSAKLCYYGGETFNPSQWFIPFAALWTTLNTPFGDKEVEIDCPIVEAQN